MKTLRSLLLVLVLTVGASACGGSIVGPHNPDGGTHNPDGGTHNPDGGSHNPDGGTHNPDGGSIG
jgi:hypothetical protein